MFLLLDTSIEENARALDAIKRLPNDWLDESLGFDHCESNVPQYVSVEILIEGFEKLIGDYGDERLEYQLLIDALQKIGNQVLVEII